MFDGFNYINGCLYRPVGSAFKSFNAVNPATEEVYGTFPETPLCDIEDAVEWARSAQLGWALESRVARADLFDKLAQLVKRDHDKLKEAISVETGKSLNESHAEVIEALHMCQYVAAQGRQPFGEVVASELASKDAYVVRKPRGVVAVISPWNFPLAIGSFWCAGPALVEGNTVVHKPSELTPMVNQMVAGLYHEAGFPDGVFNLIHGTGATGHHLVRSDVDVILFTGSAEVAREIKLYCAGTDGKTCSVEAGSKSATMVFADGDIELAADVSIASAFKLTGQRCVSSGRILVERKALAEFEAAFLKRLPGVTFGNPFDNPAPFAGPLISAEHLQRVWEYNNLVGHDEDAVVLRTPTMLTGPGHFLTPLVYRCEWGDKRFLKEEVFGPHVAIVPFDTVDDAIRIYNDTPYGLALGLVSDDFRKHRRIAQECATGMLYVNGGSIAAESHTPFSSWKKSGWGASASGTYKAVTHTMAVTVNYEQGRVKWAQGMK